MNTKFMEFEVADMRVSFTDEGNVLLETGTEEPDTYHQEFLTRSSAYLLGCALIELSRQ